MDSSRVTRAIGRVPSLSGHAVEYRWRSLPRVRRNRVSKPQGSSERVLPRQITMDQLICASLSHTHCWYEVGMLKVPAMYTQYQSRNVGRTENGERVGGNDLDTFIMCTFFFESKTLFAIADEIERSPWITTAGPYCDTFAVTHAHYYFLHTYKKCP